MLVLSRVQQNTFGLMLRRPKQQHFPEIYEGLNLIGTKWLSPDFKYIYSWHDHVRAAVKSISQTLGFLFRAKNLLFLAFNECDGQVK